MAQQMLNAHLDPDSDLASRSELKILEAVGWIDQHVELQGKSVCDLGCGPGLYTAHFHDRGAVVTGLDISTSSLTHAKAVAAQSKRSINYVEADYTKATLPQAMDVYTLIFCDYCGLSIEQRASLLKRIRSSLTSDGRLVMDVYTLSAFDVFEEQSLIEDRLWNGFWAPGEYIGFMKSFKYNAEKVSLERYLLIEPDKHWEIYNWLQYFSFSSLQGELSQAGFEIEHHAGSLSGEAFGEESQLLALVARAV
ncbi:MAG: class I SAM-dependent methyltransferase [Pseudomonadales bacterium]